MFAQKKCAPSMGSGRSVTVTISSQPESGLTTNQPGMWPGVTTGKAYLISQQYRGQDMMSFEKQSLQNEGQQRDISRFLTQSVYDSYYGVYCNPLRAVEEITLP